ncbi:hypothetical protein GCM10010377_56150 [Streptomyces viridiviolaceus]|nr:hypothetical protein GCM10010377_56150 [Streptomyces viridiviolaceus]
MNLACTPLMTVHRVKSFPLTSLQVHAIEEVRAGDVRFEIDADSESLAAEVAGAVAVWARGGEGSRIA